MEAVGEYIISVTCAALLLGVLQSLAGTKSPHALLLRLVGGLFLAFTVISPFADVRLDDLFDPMLDFTQQGSAIASEGQAAAENQLRSIIKERCEAYIVDKAMACNAELEVDIVLTQDEIPVPAQVYLSGKVSPATRYLLQQWLAQEIGIPEDDQLWIG